MLQAGGLPHLVQELWFGHADAPAEKRWTAVRARTLVRDNQPHKRAIPPSCAHIRVMPRPHSGHLFARLRFTGA